MATQDSNVPTGLRATEQGTGGSERPVHVEGSNKDASRKTAESYVGPPPRLPKGQYSNADIEDAVQPVGEFARIPMGIRLDSTGMVTGTPQSNTPYTYSPAPVGDVRSSARGSGARYNAGKTEFHQLPLFALDGAMRVMMYGASKYAKFNWAKGQAWSVCYDSMMRHLSKWQRGEELDPESGLPHLDHALCNLVFLSSYRELYPEGDDRTDAFKIPTENR